MSLRNVTQNVFSADFLLLCCSFSHTCFSGITEKRTTRITCVLFYVAGTILNISFLAVNIFTLSIITVRLVIRKDGYSS